MYLTTYERPIITKTNRLFDNFFRNAFGEDLFNEFDVKQKETNESLDFYIQCTGVDIKDIDMKIEDNILTVSVDKKEEKEYSYFSSSFKKQISIPKYLDTTKIDANLNKGILKISIPKTEEYKNRIRKIEVKNIEG